MKPKTSPPKGEQASAEDKAFAAREEAILQLIPKLREKIGATKLERLNKTPLAIAAGGIESILQTACRDCVGHPDPLASAPDRVLQLCGVVPREPKPKKAEEEPQAEAPKEP